MRSPRPTLPSRYLPFLLALAGFPLPALSGDPGSPPPRLEVMPLLVAPASAPRCQLLRVRADGELPAEPVRVELRVPGAPARSVDSGENADLARGLLVRVPPIERETEVGVAATSAAWQEEARVLLRPLRAWKIYLVQHTHTDIGYTDLPSRLNVDHLVFLDEAVRACELTDDYPEAARFRWTCEATWAVERYLAGRPRENVEAFLERVRQGRIEVTAMRMNMTDLASEELVVRNLLPVARLRKQGIPIGSALQCDVNGYPWMLPELLGEIGVTGLAGGINHTRSTLPFDTPRAIQWQSPGGGSVVAWRGEHYMFANMIGFRDSIERVLERLPGYLSDLERKGYPHSIVLMQMAGYFTDNAAPCHRASDLVREWNERFARPKLRLATLSEWFEALRREPSPPVERRAWPDWWADGVGSAPLETAIIRDTQERLGFSETFLSLARALRPGVHDRRRVFRDAYLLACLYDEHTFGASESIARPLSINTRSQWKEKSSYAHRARWLARELDDAAFALWSTRLAPRGRTAILVFNSLPRERHGPLRVEMPRGLVEEGTPFSITDAESGEPVPYQFTRGARNYREIELVVRSVPPVGYRVLFVDVGREPESAASPFRVDGAALSNGLTAVELDPERGSIASIRTPPSAENVVGRDGEHGFNQYVHERIVDERGRRFLWPARPHSAEAFRRFPLASARLEKGASGPVRTSLRLVATVTVPTGDGEDEIRVESEVALYRGLRSVYIRNRIESDGTFEPAAGYFAFPFAGSGPPRADLPGGVFVPGRDQIPGSAADWHALQRWVRVPGEGVSTTWVTMDAPLVQFGDFNTGRWTENLSLERPVFHSWVTNNYWFTNFVASQRGEYVFRYAVAAGQAGASDVAAHRFARGVCSPLRGIAVAGAGGADVPLSVSFLDLEPGGIDLIGVKEAEEIPRALVLRLRNRSGAPARARLTLSPRLRTRRVAETTVLEEERGDLEIREGAVTVEMTPWQLKTLLVVPGER